MFTKASGSSGGSTPQLLYYVDNPTIGTAQTINVSISGYSKLYIHAIDNNYQIHSQMYDLNTLGSITTGQAYLLLCDTYGSSYAIVAFQTDSTRKSSLVSYIAQNSSWTITRIEVWGEK